MLEVVQHQQRNRSPQVGNDLVRQRPAGGLPDIEVVRHHRSHVIRFTDRGELDEMDTVGEAVAEVRGHFERHPRLSDTSRPGDCQQAHPRLTEQLRKLPHRLRPPDERGHCLGQGRRRAFRTNCRWHTLECGACGGDEGSTIFMAEVEAASKQAHRLQAR